MKRRLAVLSWGVLALSFGLGATVAVGQTTVASAGGASRASLRPGDVLRLKIWLEPDWSGDYVIDEHGMAVLPRLGAMQVVDRPIDDLRTALVERYREFLNNPSVEVTPLRRISVLGAVKNPGMFPVDPSVTLGQVVNLAGGPTPESKRNVVELRRGTQRQRFDLRKTPELAAMPLESGDQIYVAERSWLSRNTTWFVSTLVAVASTTGYLLTR